MAEHPPLVALCTEIGRGHPSYLDSVVEVLREKGVELSCSTVFQESRGVSLLGWRSLAFLYWAGGRGGLARRVYNSLRTGQAVLRERSLLLRLLGRDLTSHLAGLRGILLVAHPFLAHLLSSVCRTWYVHGEIAAPPECAIARAERIFVPLRETRDRLVSSGANPASVVVTGLMIEPGLLERREGAFRERLERIGSGKSLTIGFFTSGAYPSEHMVSILDGARSVVEHDMRAVLFSGTKRGPFQSIRRKVRGWGIPWVEDSCDRPAESPSWQVRLVHRSTRHEETARACELVPELDAFVSASHERTNWAVGLGLPMFVLFPLIGTFASQNFEFARGQGVACPLGTVEAARNLGKIVKELRKTGQLAEMARRGYGVLEVDGVEAVAAQVLGG